MSILSRPHQVRKRRALEALAVLSLVACGALLMRPDGKTKDAAAAATPTPAVASSSGTSWLRGGLRKSVTAKLDARLKADPEDSEALFERSLLHRNAGNSTEELADLNRCIETKKSPMGGAHARRARLLAEQGRYHEAEDDLDEADLSFADTGNTDAYVMIGRGQYEDALAMTDILLKFDSDNKELLYIRATALSDLDRSDEAEKAFDEVYKIDPDYELTWIPCVECKAKYSDPEADSDE